MTFQPTTIDSRSRPANRSWSRRLQHVATLAVSLVIVLLTIVVSTSNAIPDSQPRHSRAQANRPPKAAGANISRRQAQDNSSADSSSQVHEREFVSPQLRVQMECQRDKTIIKLNFTRPFNGIIGAGRLETTKCKLNGNGTKYYELNVQHNSSQCDTQWDSASSSISNTLFVRFHTSLETGSDIAKNIMCRLTVGELLVGRRPLTKATRKRQTFMATDKLSAPNVAQPSGASGGETELLADSLGAPTAPKSTMDSTGDDKSASN